MKNKVLKIVKNSPINSLILCVVLVSASMYSCNKATESENQEPTKESITMDNLGQVHNYLLAEYEKSRLKSTSTPETFGEVYNEFEKILLNSEKYSTNSTITSFLSDTEKQRVLNKFANLKLDSNFHEKYKKRFIEYIQSLTNIDKDIKVEILNTIDNYSLIENTSNIQNRTSYDLVLAYNNVYKSSKDYWSRKNNLKSVNMSLNKAIIWGDATGALIGLGCGGVMSILMGAAASNMIVECYEMQ